MTRTAGGEPRSPWRRAARALLEEIEEGFIALDWEYRYVHANRAALHLTGKSLEDLLGRTPWAVFPELRDAPLREFFRQAMELGRPSVSDHRSIFTDTWSEVRVYPTISGLSAYFNDISGRKRVEQALQQSRAELAEAVAQRQLALDAAKLGGGTTIH